MDINYLSDEEKSSLSQLKENYLLKTSQSVSSCLIVVISKFILLLILCAIIFSIPKITPHGYYFYNNNLYYCLDNDWYTYNNNLNDWELINIDKKLMHYNTFYKINNLNLNQYNGQRFEYTEYYNNWYNEKANN